MAGGVAVSRWISPEKVENFDLSPLNSELVHVLAVDDSLVDRKVIERLLKITSCKVTAVDSGRRALQFLGLGEEQVDMVITDYCMPEMTGYELLKKIKESSNFKEIPVVIMSSENVLSRIDSCLEEGAEDFIMKPVKLADVKRLRDSMTSASATNKRNEVSEVCARVADEATLFTSPPSISLTRLSESSPLSSGVLTSALEPRSPAPLDSTVRRLEMAELL